MTEYHAGSRGPQVANESMRNSQRGGRKGSRAILVKPTNVARRDSWTAILSSPARTTGCQTGTVTEIAVGTRSEIRKVEEDFVFDKADGELHVRFPNRHYNVWPAFEVACSRLISSRSTQCSEHPLNRHSLR